MKLSQPSSAREINIYRFLCTLRDKGKDGISRAEISRILTLNKVSVGEIAKALTDAQIVLEKERNEVINGRRPFDLTLNATSRLVLAVDIGPYNVNVALCDLFGTSVKIERFYLDTSSTVNEFVVHLLKSCVRTINLVGSEKILGAGITVDALLSEDGRVICSSSFLPWKDIPIAEIFEKNLHCNVVLSNRTSALVNAEKQENHLIASTDGLLYLNWSMSLTLASVSFGHVFSVSNEFGKMIIDGKTLNAICSSKELGATADIHLRDLWSSVPYIAFFSISKALNLAYEITGFSSVLIGGEGATISEKGLEHIRENCPQLQIEHSCLGDRAYVKSAAELALDTFFYKRSMLEDMKDLV